MTKKSYNKPFIGRSQFEWDETERNDVNGMDRRFVSFVPAPFIGNSGGGIIQVFHPSAVGQVVTLTGGVTVLAKQ